MGFQLRLCFFPNTDQLQKLILTPVAQTASLWLYVPTIIFVFAYSNQDTHMQ